MAVNNVLAGGFQIVDLGTLGGNYSIGYGINSNGFVTGEAAPSGNATHAFLSRITNIVDLTPGSGGGVYGIGRALNGSNIVVGQSAINGQYRAALFIAGSGKVDLGTLGGDYSDAHAINNAGQIVGEAITSFLTGGNDHAFLRGTASTNLIDLGTLGGSYSSGLGINNFTHIVGEADTAGNGTHAFFYDGTNMIDLGTFGGRDSSAAAINDLDQITGYAVTASGQAHAFFYNGGVIQDLGVMGGLESAGTSINASGQVVGYYTYVPYSSTITHAFYWDGKGMFDLNYLIPPNSGWTELTAAQGINDSRQITGYGTINGQTHAFLLKPDTNSTVAVALLPNQIVAPGDSVVFTNYATDTSNPTNTFTFSVDPGSPAGATIDPNTGICTWTAGAVDGLTTNYIIVRATVVGGSQSGTGGMRVVVVGRPRLMGMSSNVDGTISTSWSSYPNTFYTLQYATDLTNAQWTDLNSAYATTTTTTFTDGPLTDSQRFYRVTSSFGTSDPAGFIAVNCLGNSDTYISTPFTRPIAANAIVDSVAGNVVTIQTAQGWTSNQLVYGGTQTNTFFLRFDSGAAEGHRFLITANSSTTLTLNVTNDSLAGVVHNDRLSIIPAWTIGTIFPGGSGVNVSPTVGNRYTEVLAPDVASVGINLSATKVYYFQGGLWKLVGQGSTDHGPDYVPPSTYLIVRHNVATNTLLTMAGAIALPKLATVMTTSTNKQQDNAIGLTRPVTVSLDDSGLISSGGFLPSPLPGLHTDELLTFNNSVALRNKSSAFVYYYWNGAWRRVGAGSLNVGSDPVFAPGTGIIIRKGTNSTPAVWVNAPNY